MQDIVIVGAGAAGCFIASVLSELDPSRSITLLEKTRVPLAKVKISGGGRCNVTHNCFDVQRLIDSYPRGKDFLRSAFHRFQPKDMIEWLKDHDVEVVPESDGRCFPTTHRSQTIIDCLMRCIENKSVTLCLEKEVTALEQAEHGWNVLCKDDTVFKAKKVVFATGGLTRSYPILEAIGHHMVAPVPSLFSFELEESWIKELPGSSLPSATVHIQGTSFSSKGPLLITHLGISGPAVLRLSSYAARWFALASYQAQIGINWTGDLSAIQVKETLYAQKKQASGKKILLSPLFSLSKNLWRALLTQMAPSCLDKTWAQLSRDEINQLSEKLSLTYFTMVGKSTHKEEFVTAGGVNLDEVHPKTLESRKASGLYFTGEVLDIDGITGGFNFQSAWTTAWCAAQAIHQSLLENR